MSCYLKFIGALYASNYIRRLKVCYCGVEFSDVTKRNLQNTCSNICKNAKMVQTRKLRGNYKQTDEQKQSRSKVMIDAYASGKRVTSDSERLKYSETMKKTWAEGRIDTNNHWSKTDEGRKKLSNLAKITVYTPEIRARMSKSAQNRLRTKRETHYTSAKGGIRLDLGMYFRSNWEANFARILNAQGKFWTYEEYSFQLEESLSYTPDFYVKDENTFYEIKGRMNEKSQKQIRLMHEKFPNILLIIVDSAKYDQLRLEYKRKLPTWEGK